MAAILRLINRETVFFLLLNQILNMKDKSDKSIFDYTYREFKSLPVEDAIKLAGQDEKKYQEWCEQYGLEIQEDNKNPSGIIHFSILVSIKLGQKFSHYIFDRVSLLARLIAVRARYWSILTFSLKAP